MDLGNTLCKMFQKLTQFIHGDFKFMPYNVHGRICLWGNIRDQMKWEGLQSQ